MQHAEETVDLAIQYRDETGLVVGVDLSGDGTVRIPSARLHHRYIIIIMTLLLLLLPSSLLSVLL